MRGAYSSITRDPFLKLQSDKNVSLQSPPIVPGTGRYARTSTDQAEFFHNDGTTINSYVPLVVSRGSPSPCYG